MILILLGPPGSGKGTVAELIHEKYSYPIIASGELLRKEITQETAVGQNISNLLTDGELVPDSIINALITERIEKLESGTSFILDGYPRTLNQAHALEQQIDEKLLIFYLNIPKDILMERLLERERSDDTKEIIENRFDVYQKDTEPLIRYYLQSNRLITITKESSKKVLREIKPFLENPTV